MDSPNIVSSHLKVEHSTQYSLVLSWLSMTLSVLRSSSVQSLTTPASTGPALLIDNERHDSQNSEPREDGQIGFHRTRHQHRVDGRATDKRQALLCIELSSPPTPMPPLTNPPITGILYPDQMFYIVTWLLQGHFPSHVVAHV